MTDASRRFALGAAGTLVALAVVHQRPPAGHERWQRTNFRGRPVSLLAGPALAFGASLASSSPGAAAIAGLGAGALGAYDDAAGAQDAAKGLRGHLTAFRRGRVTTGSAKLLGLPVVGALAAAAGGDRRPADVLLGAGVVAGTANALNLFDLRPGRALKVGLLAAGAIGEPGVAGACAVLLPDDLGERTMLGDAGANALGAVLGVGLLTGLGRGGRLAVLIALAALTVTSERISFTAAIERTPPLRWLDQLGRRP